MNSPDLKNNIVIVRHFSERKDTYFSDNGPLDPNAFHNTVRLKHHLELLAYPDRSLDFYCSPKTRSRETVNLIISALSPEISADGYPVN
jgi:phosphohistidine phosphatase SixA